MLLLLAVTLASPAPARAADAWYHPDQVAEKSALFQASAEQIGPRYQALESRLRQLSPAVEDLELAATLAADHLPGTTSAYALQTRKQAAALLIQAQGQVDLVQEGYARSFGAALDRALAEVGRGHSVAECDGGGGVQAMMGRGRSCAGEDLNAALAAHIDADATLRGEIAAINALPWPEAELGGQAQPVLALTGDAGHVQLAPLARGLWADRLTRRSDDLDRALAPLEDRLASTDAETLDQALAEAREHRAAYERALAADGAVLIPLLGEALDGLKKGAGQDVGLCVNPVALGGCPGQDRSAELLPLLLADKKLARALAALP